MKRILLLVFATLSLVCSAQNRVDDPAPELSFKSQSIKKALYWEQNNGKWESRKNNKLVYLGEGVDVENFEALFIGEFSGHRYLFLDKHDYFWLYPNLQSTWYQTRTMHMALLSDKDFDTFKNLEVGKVFVFAPSFTQSMSKANDNYSFPFFLSLHDNLLSAEETMYNTYLRIEGKPVADAYWRDKYPEVPFMTIKRVASKEGDVVRFRFGAVTELIDACYFEVPYSDWMKLFLGDKSNSYK